MLTICIIARDEALRIHRCLESVCWADEIVVVVDDRTADDTAAVARTFTDRVFVHAFEGYSEQRRRADALASHDWVFSIDCDEVMPEALAQEVREAVRSGAYDAYRVPHLDYMFGRWIRHGGWYPQYHTRLYRRGVTRWQRAVHEKPEVNGRLGTLRTPLLHYSHARVEDWVAKMARYTSIEAHAMHEARAPMAVWRILLEPPGILAYRYFVQQGWRDGAHGLALALLLGCTRLVRNLKLWDLRYAADRREESSDEPPVRRAAP